jgi:hypothetical protein
MTDSKPVESWLTDMDGVLVHEELALPWRLRLHRRSARARTPVPGIDQQFHLHPS